MTNKELIDWLNFSDRLKFVNSAYYEKILQINDYEIDKDFNMLSKLGVDDATNFTFQYVIYKNYKLYGEEEHELALKEVYKLLKTIKKYLIARDINIDVRSLTSRIIECKFNIRKALKFERIKSCDLTYKIKIDNNIFSIRANDMNRMIIESDSKALDNKYKYMPALIIIKNDKVIFIYDIMTKMEKYDLLLCTSNIASSYRSWIV